MQISSANGIYEVRDFCRHTRIHIHIIRVHKSWRGKPSVSERETMTRKQKRQKYEKGRNWRRIGDAEIAFVIYGLNGERNFLSVPNSLKKNFIFHLSIWIIYFLLKGLVNSNRQAICTIGNVMKWSAKYYSRIHSLFSTKVKLKNFVADFLIFILKSKGVPNMSKKYNDSKYENIRNESTALYWRKNKFLLIEKLAGKIRRVVEK